MAGGCLVGNALVYQVCWLEFQGRTCFWVLEVDTKECGWASGREVAPQEESWVYHQSLCRLLEMEEEEGEATEEERRAICCRARNEMWVAVRVGGQEGLQGVC